MSARVVAIMPTLGASAQLGEALAALEGQVDVSLEIRVIAQGEAVLAPGVAQGAARVLRDPQRLGFAAAVHRGLEPLDSEYVALVNDDAVVEPGWLAALVAALDAEPTAAAAQGMNLDGNDRAVADGRGIAWNRWWQAVQIGRGEAPLPADAPISEVFGVSATAALYRSSALSACGARPFDEILDSYYEDVDLAGRLRSARWRSLSVPAARCAHAGSLTGRTLGALRWRLIYGNRLLVLARLLGDAFWPRLPRILIADLRDLGRRNGERRRGILGGWRRARQLSRQFLRRGAPLVPLAELRAFREV